jgi:hypothetical protein
MPASSKKALSGTKSKAQTNKAETTRKRTQTEKGKYNASNRKRTKRTTEGGQGSESDESAASSEEGTHRPRKKRSKLTQETGSEDAGGNTSNIEDVVEVTSGNGSESEIQVRFINLFAK